MEEVESKISIRLAKLDVMKNLKTILQCTTFCTLCYDTKEELLYLENSLLIEESEHETLSFKDLLESVFGNTDNLLTSDYICKPCKSLACISYAFIHKTRRNANVYSKYLDQLNRETTELTASFNNDWNRAVIVLDDYKKIKVLKPTKTREKYVCDKCGKHYMRKSFLIKHFKKHKSGCFNGCPHCNIRPCVHEKYIVAFNQQRQLKVKPMSCICGFKFGQTLPYLIAHVNKEHLNIKPNICEVCGKSFYLESQYRKHFEYHHDNKCICELCFRRFRSMTHLETHLKTCTEKHINQIDMSPYSSQYSHSKRPLKDIKRKKRIYKCQICDKVLKTRLELRSHINNTHEKKPNLCMYCNKQYNSRQEYLKHVQSEEHRNNIPYGFRHRCTHCDYSANTSHMLKAHINRIHLNVRPFECEHCHKRYFDSIQLKNHVKSHTGQRKPKVCDICGAHLAGPTALKKHRRLHTGENPYSCQYCEVKTNCASSLKMHIMRKHMEPSIQCPLCDLKFHTRNNAREHVKKTHWKSKEKFDYTKLKGLAPEDYDFFRDRRKAVL